MNNYTLRLNIQQPSLAKYRLPLYRLLDKEPSVDLRLLYSQNDKGLPNDIPDGFDAEFIPMRIWCIGGRRFMWHSAQWDFAKRSESDVLILSWDIQYISLIPSLLRARLNGVKTILWGHGYSKNESRVRKFIRDSVGRLADALVFYDHTTAQHFIDSGWKKKRIHIAPNSLDQEEIQDVREKWLAYPDKLERFMESNNLNEHKNLIYIGRIYSENRLDLLIKSLPAVLAVHPKVQILLIGKENKHTDELKLLAHSLNVEHALRWLGAIYDENEIAPYMLASSLCCYPANVGLSMMHAMGYGVPVITGDDIKSHNPEIHVLDNGLNGSLFLHLDTKDLAKKIIEILDNEKQLSLMGKNARKTVLNGFMTQDMVKGFMGAIRAIYHGY